MMQSAGAVGIPMRASRLRELERGQRSSDEHLTFSAATFAWDANARIVGWSDRAGRLLGFAAHEILGRFPPFVLAADRRSFRSDCRAALAGEGDLLRFLTVRTRDNAQLQVAITLSREISVDGTLRGIATIENTAARIDSERRIAMLESLARNSRDALLVTASAAVDGVRHRIVYVNSAFERMTGYGAAELIGRTPEMLQGPATDAAELAKLRAAVARRESTTTELVNYRKDGSPYLVSFSIAPVASDGPCAYFVSVQTEMTHTRARERYEAGRREILDLAFRDVALDVPLTKIGALLGELIPGSRTVVACDHQGRLVFGNVERCDARDDAALRAYRERTAIWSADSAGSGVWCALPLAADYARGAGVGVLCVSVPDWTSLTAEQRDAITETARLAALIIERHRDRERLEQLTRLDPVTELPNRRRVEELLAASLAQAAADGSHVGVGVFGIDRLRAIIDAYGHRAGDELVRSIAGRLAEHAGSGEIVGSMTGDTFVVIFTGLARDDDASAAAQRLIDRIAEPFGIDGRNVVVRASCGLAFSSSIGGDPRGLLLAAEQALYRAKSRGGGFCRASEPSMLSARRAIDIEADLSYALERGELELHFQQVFDLSSGHAIGAEALMRWNHASLGIIGPTEFIPLAEASGTIVKIGAWAIDEAARVARGWADAGHDAFVAVNVSALQFDSPSFVGTVTAALDRYALEPRRLHLELTESLVMRDPEASAAIIQELKAIGVHIVIDDFGTGYSSLAYLQRFAFDTLKIDRAFVRGIGDPNMSGRSEHIVAAVVLLSEALGVSTIAEGVENTDQYAFIRTCGCTAVQGFLCARPVPAAALAWR